MRIALILNSFPRNPTEDPVFPAAWEMARELKRQGHSIMVVCFCDPHKKDDVDGAFDVEGIQVLRAQRVLDEYNALNAIEALPTTSYLLGGNRQLYQKFLPHLKDFNPDVIEVQEFNALGLFLAADHQYPIVVRCYGPLGTIMRAGYVGAHTQADIEIVQIMELSTIISADGLVSICNDMAKNLSALTGRNTEDFTIIRTPFSIEGATQTEIRKPDSESFPRLFFWGLVIKLKGVDTLIESLVHLKKKFPNFKLKIGGREMLLAGDSEPLAEVLKKRVIELGLEKNVEFSGFLERETIISEAKNADICIFPSRYETACYTCLEAMSYGVPVVASRVGGLPEYCLDGETGLLFETGNSKDLAEKIITLASDYELRKRFSQAGIERVKTFCDPKVTADLTLKKYEQAIRIFESRNPDQNLAFKFLISKLGYLLDNVLAVEMPGLLGKSVQLEPVSNVSESGIHAPEVSQVVQPDLHIATVTPSRNLITRAFRKLKRLANI